MFVKAWSVSTEDFNIGGSIVEVLDDKLAAGIDTTEEEVIDLVASK